MARIRVPKSNRLEEFRKSIQQINSRLGYQSEPTFAGITLTGLTANRLVKTDSNSALASVTDLTNWIAGTANEIEITDDEDGTVTIGIVDPLIVAKGGTGVATLTDHSLLLGSGTDAITPLGAATNGQIPIGSTGADPVLASITGTTNQITVTNGAGSITLSIPNPFDIPGKLTAGAFASPIDVTVTREYGFEIHYSGNNYNATAIRSRASAITTDTSAQIQGGLFQAANNDGINVGVLNGLVAEAIGKSTANAATVSTMRGALIGAEWNDYDTITSLKTLHIRTHTRNASGDGSFTIGYGIYIENEAVGGNGQALDAGICFKDTNLSGGNKAFTYGIDFSGGSYETAEIKFSNGETIDNLTDGRITINGNVLIYDDNILYIGDTDHYLRQTVDGLDIYADDILTFYCYELLLSTTLPITVDQGLAVGIDAWEINEGQGGDRGGIVFKDSYGNFYGAVQEAGIISNFITDEDFDIDDVITIGSDFYGMLVVGITDNNYVGLFRIDGTSLASTPVTIISASPNVFSITKDTANRFNVYFETGNLKIQNKAIESRTIRIGHFGVWNQ